MTDKIDDIKDLDFSKMSEDEIVNYVLKISKERKKLKEQLKIIDDIIKK